MFCSKCGSQLPEGAKFCGNCGAPVEEVNAVVSESPAVDDVYDAAETGRRLGNRDLIIIGLAAIAAVVVIMLFAGIGNGFRKPIRQYFKGYEQFDASKIADSMAPFIYESDGYSKSEYKADVQEELDQEKAYLSETGSFKISYTIENARNCGTYEISSVMDDMTLYYGLSESDIPNVRKMKSVNLDITFEYSFDGEKHEETEAETAYVGKIGSKWYMIDMN